MTQEKIDEFESLVKPLIKWLNDNRDPHSLITVDCTSAQVYGGECSVYTEEFLKD